LKASGSTSRKHAFAAQENNFSMTSSSGSIPLKQSAFSGSLEVLAQANPASPTVVRHTSIDTGASEPVFSSIVTLQR
jgi:hypothetical protein